MTRFLLQKRAKMSVLEFKTCYGLVRAKTEGDRDSKLLLFTPYACKDELKLSFEGARWDPKRRVWTARNCTRNWFILEHVWQDSEFFNRYYGAPPDDLVLRTDLPLRDDQRERARLQVWRRCTLDTTDMGGGKTLTIFAALDHLWKELKAPTIWWLGSKAALRAYEAERKKWKPLFRPDLIGTYDSIHKAIENWDHPCPQVVVTDELHAGKNPKSQRFQGLLGLRDLMHQAHGDECWWLGTTGTPTPKNYLDLWAICEVVRPGFIREGNWYKYRDRYCNLIDMGRYKQVDRENPFKPEADKIPHRVKGLCFGDPAPKRQPPIRVQLRAKVAPNLLSLARSVTMSSDSALATLRTLRELSDGFYRDEGSVVRGDCPKDGLLSRLLKIHESYKRIVVFAAYRESVDRCVDVCRAEGWEVLRVDGRGWAYIGAHVSGLEDFASIQRCPHRIAYVANPKSGGEGLDLTAAPSCVFYSNTFSGGVRHQAEKRVDRPGQRPEGAWIIDLFHLDTDEYVYNNLLAKRKQSAYTLSIIRETLGCEAEAEEEPHEREVELWLRTMAK